MNTSKASKEPITNIVRQISKLKKELKSIKSMKTIPLLQTNTLHNSNYSINLKRLTNKKHTIKSTTNKQKQGQILDLELEKRELIESERKKQGSKIDMSICKEIRRSLSRSDSKSRSKTKQKRSKEDRNQERNQTHKDDMHEQRNQTQRIKSKKPKEKQQQQKVAQFDHIYAHTRSIRREKGQTQDDKYLHSTKKQDNPNFQLKTATQNQPMIRQEISFGNQTSFNRKKLTQNNTRNDSTFGGQINFRELNTRVKTRLNYEPQFNEINFILESEIGENFEKNPQPYRKQSFISSYVLKGEVLISKLKKTLMRHPNFCAVMASRMNNEIPVQIKRIFNDLNEQSTQVLEQRYTNYLQQVQCDINQIINLFNQYQNQKQSITFMYKNHRPLTEFIHENNRRSQKENFSRINNSNEEDKFNREQKQNQSEFLKRQVKQSRKQIKRLEKEIQQKDQQFTELQFKYILKCEQQQNSTKFNGNVPENSSQDKFITQNHQIQSHIQILQQENLQLYEKVQLLTRQIQKYQQSNQQFQAKTDELTRTIDGLTKDLEVKQKSNQLQAQDINLAQIQIDSFKQKIQNLTQQKQRQREKYKKKVLQAELSNQKLKKELQSQSKSSKINQNQFRRLQSQNYKLQQSFSNNQTNFQREINELKRLNQKYQRNEKIINQKVEELTKQHFTVKKTNEQLTIDNEKLKREFKQIYEEMTKYRQRLIEMEKIEKLNEGLNKQNSKLILKIEEIKSEQRSLCENVGILKGELEIEYKRVRQLEESIERYKDRCIKAEIQVKQGRYLEQRTSSKEKQDEDIEEIHQIIKSHKEKLNLE